jgi:S-adenosylmethionine/arginine decarboxylase-like enzyme
MGKLIISEQERQDILGKYNDENTNKEVLVYLRRHFTTHTYPGVPDQVMISINDKLYPVYSNKKYVKNRIYNIVKEVFDNLDEAIIKKTIKNYLDYL